MGARLRRGGEASVISLIVVLALIGSAWLAYATTAPKGATSYPVVKAKVRGNGVVGDCSGDHDETSKTADVFASGVQCTEFTLRVDRSSTGELSGAITVECEATGLNLTFKSKNEGGRITSLSITNHTASFSANGGLEGKANKGKAYTADTTVTDNDDVEDTFATTIKDSSGNVVCAGSGIVHSFVNLHRNADIEVLTGTEKDTD